jgi:dTDP-3-amino-3,4,6-trideoxy-alpha-D-glucose transaminase
MEISVPFYPLKEYLRDHQDWLQDSIQEVTSSGYAIGGKAVTDFEDNFAKFTGADFCIGVANGLDAIRLTLEALNIGPGDEVIVPAFTFIATWLAVTQTEATPIPCDVSLENAGMIIENLPITPKTKAVIFVHLYGHPTDLSSLAKELEAKGIFLIEDCAQAHGAKVNGKEVGTFGIAGCYSFYPTKNLGGVGDGGGVITNDSHLADTIRSLRSYGVGAEKYLHTRMGWNSRLDPIQAKFLDCRLANLARENTHRQNLANNLDTHLAVSSVFKPLYRKNATGDVWHLYVVQVEGDRADIQRRLLMNGIQTDTHYPLAIHDQECFKKEQFSYLRGKTYPNSEFLAATVLSLPLYPWMTDEIQSQLFLTLDKVEKELQ